MASSVESKPPAPYEFEPAQNRLFEDLGGRMKFVGLFFKVIGALAVVVGAITATSRETDAGIVALVVLGVVHLALGFWTRRAGAEFLAVARTRDADMGHLLHALGHLKKAYTLIYWWALLAMGLLLVSLVASIVLREGAVVPVALV
jgi:hypothetical protein